MAVFTGKGFVAEQACRMQKMESSLEFLLYLFISGTLFLADLRRGLCQLCMIEKEIQILLYGLLQVKKKKQRLLIIAYALLISGAAGNLIDRLRFGYVRDFFEWYPFHYSFPVFNVADVALTFGVILLVIGVWLTEKKA